MKTQSLYSVFTAVIIILVAACTPKNNTSLARVNTILDSLTTEFAPDKRVALFDIKALQDKNNAIILLGDSNLPEAIDGLRAAINNSNLVVLDSTRLLPESALEGNVQGVVRISVANLRGAPKHSAELVTQVILGTPVRVLKKQDSWYYVQSPEGYLAWVDSAGITAMNTRDYDTWAATKKLIFTATYGHAFAEPAGAGSRVSDLVAGNILSLVAQNKTDYEVAFPDGRTGFIAIENAMPYQAWLKTLDQSGASLKATAETLLGVPYLWGGTSTKGVDCSGFTKTVYLLNGMVIPRDASQQIHTGMLIDNDRTFDNMEVGDLLFFGKPATPTTKERVIHVGMWIGNNEFIHSAGEVHISSVDENAANFDDYNYNRYLRTKRILKQPHDRLLNLLETPMFND